MKKILFPIFAAIVFMIMQGLTSVVLMIPVIIENAHNTEIMSDPNAMMALIPMEGLAIAVVVSGVLTIAVLSGLKMIEWKKVVNVCDVDWKKAVAFIAAAIVGIFACDLVEEILDLPDLIEVQMTGMAKTAIGALSIGVLGPICEEFIFREGMLGYMLRNNVKPWAAIIATSLIFGIVHGNPAQIPFAAAMGIVLGYIYYKTGNIVLSSIIHIINNSVAVWMMNALGDKADEFSMVEWVGGMPVAITIIVVGICLCVGMLYMTGNNIRKARIVWEDGKPALKIWSYDEFYLYRFFK